ncbi:MAG: hypothetical protein L0Z07_03125 [Planctomycetes bacterium]|nr:hypothetical protein [Planctomycetota bacterium]
MRSDFSLLAPLYKLLYKLVNQPALGRPRGFNPDVKLDLYGSTAGTYAGLDRFGRTVDQSWYNNTGSPVAVDRIKYGYDHAGNRTWREDTVAKAQSTPKYQDEFYTYDGLGRRIVRTVNGFDGPTTYDCYYNDQWQLLEERKDAGPNPVQQFVWHPHYVDALAVRYYV